MLLPNSFFLIDRKHISLKHKALSFEHTKDDIVLSQSGIRMFKGA